MRERDDLRPVVLPILHGVREAALLPLTQMPGVGILADGQRQRDVGQKSQKRLAPMLGAFRPWRQVNGFSGSGITKSHAENGNFLRIVKHTAVNAHPAPQTVTAGVIEGNAGGMHPPARRLANNENAGRLGNLENRARTERQMGLAGIARPGRRYRCFKSACHRSEVTHHTFLRQGLVLLFRKLDRIAAGRRILDRHRRHLIEALGVNADVLQRVRNSDFFAQC